MTSADFYRDEVWRNLGVMGARAALEAEVRSDFVAAVRRTGRPLRAEPAVLALLHDAGGGESVGPAAGTRKESRSPDSDRKAVWRFLRTSGQLPASWLLLVFRVLWYTKLRERQWSSSEIAHFLGFESPRHFRVSVKRRFGIRLGQLNALRYGQVLSWAAFSVTSGLDAEGLRTLVTPLLASDAMTESRVGGRTSRATSA